MSDDAIAINQSGLLPVEYRVLIKPEPIEDTDPLYRKCKALGIQIPNDPKEREQMAQQRGTLVDHGGNAFDDWKGAKPTVGCKVIFGKYAGYNTQGADGEVYRVCNDKDISAILVHG